MNKTYIRTDTKWINTLDVIKMMEKDESEIVEYDISTLMKQNDFSFITFLIDKEYVSINENDEDNLLYCAICNGSVKWVKFLEKKGGDLMKKINKRTFYELAAKFGKLDVLKYLNRLSDHLFVLARKLSKDLSAQEIKWVPEK